MNGSCCPLLLAVLLRKLDDFTLPPDGAKGGSLTQMTIYHIKRLS